jgi:pyridoxine 5'-phosphate synthase PdxJ
MQVMIYHRNLKYFNEQMSGLMEVSIGHALISESIPRVRERGEHVQHRLA